MRYRWVIAGIALGICIGTALAIQSLRTEKVEPVAASGHGHAGHRAPANVPMKNLQMSRAFAYFYDPEKKG